MSFRRPPFSLGRLLGTALLAGLLAACDVPSARTGTTGNGQTQTGQTGTGQTGTGQPQTGTPSSRPARDPVSGLPFIAARDLPPEGQRTLRLIAARGPFPYRKDGSAFGNREGILPRRAGGGYHEYTVPTPGEGDRGARRIVCAALTPPDAECYYSADHYTTFRRIGP
ncbi:hypothetical protein DEIPH_ctg079orf0037 [Deinococcus phoenicis]|uniref:Uncharacterized protein n=1 Tax=Deinococcus phoenicis TaxID=1476583 RepID=A0A016QKS5_9DEIO|nr:ribonuclease domain-containing protein [Deinococcus phoenicis]EYB66653.1 hypothetical protein DEIPH_ctg079orf0037 [Deinococcus phoenicis]